MQELYNHLFTKIFFFLFTLLGFLIQMITSYQETYFQAQVAQSEASYSVFY